MESLRKQHEKWDFQSSSPQKIIAFSQKEPHSSKHFSSFIEHECFPCGWICLFCFVFSLLLFNSVSLTPQSKTQVSHTIGLLHFKLHFWFMFSMLSEGCAPHLIVMSGGGGSVAWNASSFLFFIFLEQQKIQSLQKNTHTCCIKNKQVWRDIKYLNTFKGWALRPGFSFKNECLQFIVFIFT